MFDEAVQQFGPVIGWETTTGYKKARFEKFTASVDVGTAESAKTERLLRSVIAAIEADPSIFVKHVHPVLVSKSKAEYKWFVRRVAKESISFREAVMHTEPESGGKMVGTFGFPKPDPQDPSRQMIKQACREAMDAAKQSNLTGLSSRDDGAGQAHKTSSDSPYHSCTRKLGLWQLRSYIEAIRADAAAFELRARRPGKKPPLLGDTNAWDWIAGDRVRKKQETQTQSVAVAPASGGLTLTPTSDVLMSQAPTAPGGGTLTAWRTTKDGSWCDKCGARVAVGTQLFGYNSYDLCEGCHSGARNGSGGPELAELEPEEAEPREDPASPEVSGWRFGEVLAVIEGGARVKVRWSVCQHTGEVHGSDGEETVLAKDLFADDSAGHHYAHAIPVQLTTVPSFMLEAVQANPAAVGYIAPECFADSWPLARVQGALAHPATQQLFEAVCRPDKTDLSTDQGSRDRLRKDRATKWREKLRKLVSDAEAAERAEKAWFENEPKMQDAAWFENELKMKDTESFVVAIGRVAGWLELVRALQVAHGQVLDRLAARPEDEDTWEFLLLLERRLNLLRHDRSLWHTTLAQDGLALQVP